MTRGQRRLVFIWVLFAAWGFHVAYCDWGIREVNRYPLLAFNDGQQPDPRRGRTMMPAHTGLFASGSAQTSVLLGVVLPISMVCADVWLLLGWRAAARRSQGLCAKCGYDLRGVEGGKCPECAAEREG